MSTTVDQRVVEMRFDNKHFEKNVADTMSTLDKFKQKLRLDGATQGLADVDAAAKKVNMGGLGDAVEKVGLKFSALYSIADQALRNITTSVQNTATRMAKALTVDPIMQGFSEYETKIGAIQTIMSNTASKGTTMEDVTRVIGELNTYADKTIYNFAEMTRNIGTFTAAGVGLEESASAIQGIANLAASSGSTSQQASTAMYQLSQALAAGTVKLMDWNSVVNAGMGGEKFQEALKATARDHGVAVDDIIKKNGSFRESLQEGWITADILNETLNKFTVEGAKSYAKSMMDSGKWTQEQADALIKEAQAMEDAATKVKTFTQLWDTLKESAQSGWAQTWEIIIGDFEEAKDLLTGISDVIGGFINKSAEARNEMLQGWKDLGGRTKLIESMWNIFNALQRVITPIAKAFREIFPPTTAAQLLKITTSLETFTSKLLISKDTSDKLKRTFKGVFALLDIGVQIISAVAGGFMDLVDYIMPAGNGILGFTASIGDFIVGLDESIKSAGTFKKIIEGIGKFLKPIADGVVSFGKTIKDTFSTIADTAEVRFEPLKALGEFLKGIFVGLGKLIQKITPWLATFASSVSDFFANIMDGMTSSIQGADYNAIFDVLGGGILAGIGLAIKKVIDGAGGILDGASGFVENLNGLLEGVGEALNAFSQSIKAKTLKTIATAIAILAASLFVISLIDSDKLVTSLAAIAALFAELMGAMTIFGKLSDGPGMKNIAKVSTTMIKMSAALLILAVAMKIMSSMSWQEMGVGLISITVGLGALVGAVKLLPEKDVMDAAKAIKKMSTALVIFAVAMKIMGSMSWQEMGVGLVTMAAGLGAMVAAVNLLPEKKLGSSAAAMQKLSTSLLIFAAAMKIMGSMSWSELAVGLTATVVGLAAMVGALHLLPKDIGLKAVGMIAMATAMVILGAALKIMASMTWGEMAVALVALAGSLLIIAGAMALMTGALPGAAALLVVSASLAVLAPVLKLLGSMTWGEIARGLVAIAGAFAVLGIAGLVLGPLVPAILGLAAALALLGIGVVAIGAGILALGAGLTMLSTAGAAAAGALVIIVTSIISLIPYLIEQVGVGIVAFCGVIANSSVAICSAITAVLLAVIQAITACIPPLLDCLGLLLTEFLAFILTYVPQIVDTGVQLIVALLDGIAKNIPKIVKAAVDIVVAFIRGIGQELPRIIDAGFKMIIDFINGMADSIRSNTPLLIDAVNNLMDAIIGAIKAWFTNFVSKGKEIVGEIKAGIKQKFSDIKNTAKDMMQGFVNGIKEKFTSIKNAAKNVVKGAVDAVKNFLGIKSPSRVFMSIGKFADEGLAVGLKKYADVASKAAVGVGDSVLTGIQDSLKINSPSLVFKEDVGRYIVEGIAEGITASTSAEEAAKKKASNITSAFKTELDKTSTKIKTAELEYDLWESKNPNASETERETAKIANLNAQIDHQNRRVTLAQSEYFETLNNFGENATETQEAYNKYLQEQLTLSNKMNEVTKLQNDAIARQAEAAKALKDAKTETHDLEYAKWDAIYGNDASDAAKVVAELNSIGKKLPGAVQDVADARTKYNEALAAHGEESIETREAYNTLLEAETALASMSSKASKIHADTLKEQIEAKKEYDRMYAQFYAAAMNQGISEEDLAKAVQKETGFDPEAFATLQNMDVATAAANAMKLVTQAYSTGGTEAFNALAQEFETWGTTCATSVGTGIQNEKSGIMTAVEAMGVACADAIRADQSRWVEAGKYVVEGFVKGIQDNVTAAANAAAAMAKATYLAAMSSLSIASPSKKFAELGMYADLGFAQGFKKYANEAAEASDEVARGTLDGMNATVRKLAEAVGSDIDPQPVIRPILDTTDIQNGAAMLNGLFAYNTASLASVNARLANGGSISMNHTINNSNAEVVRAITQLRGDFDSLVKAIGGMHIRMDSGTVVGELIGGIDSKLGQIMNHKGRGN